MVELSPFIQLSEELTGVTPLNHDLAAQYLQRLSARPEAAELPNVVATFEDILAKGGDTAAAVKRRILDKDELRPVCTSLILLWYLGSIPAANEPSPPEHYYQGLFWRLIHAHPPGLSGGYFGHWAYPPDN